MITKISNSAEETEGIALNLARNFKKPAIICLYGELGSGKTVFVKGFAEGLGISKKEIKSPTYTFLREYHNDRNNRIHFYHFDFYRLQNISDLLSHELKDFFMDKNSWKIIEWPERIANILPTKKVKIKIEHLGADSRKITIHD